ncbi:zinc-binding alcohol dehydrogenase family protein [Anaerotruncus rubiinfantis]|uniref:zinc-binding alcohol dehydrogenase family protein n=1 Tax=Anaerotruncus rubiinfantis TaxID=1720200 RepID=UPI0008305823|nr:zinc-binding alcohol dehydrogenase family protein [Anaerotruncus rubiinfantis]
MKAVKIPEPWKVELVELPKPEPKQGEALLKVHMAGICGSDIGAFRGANSLVSYPRVIGHEIAGEILSIPQDNKKGLKPGDKVIVDPYLYCGECYPCSIGRTNCCTSLRVLGVHIEGGMAEYFTHPADMLVKVPDDMEWELIPLAEPLTIALHGLHRAQLKAGEHIAISGAGPIGLLAAMGALHYGAEPILIDLVEERLQMARELGVRCTVNLAKENLEEKIEEYTNGRMAQVAMEASGAKPAILNAFNIVANAGRVILTGWPKDATEIDTGLFTRKELDVRGARTSAGEFEEAVELIYTGKVDARGILTKVISLEEAPETIIDIEKNPGDYLKVNVRMN